LVATNYHSNLADDTTGTIGTMQFISDYATGSRYAAGESGANVTSGHILTARATPSSTLVLTPPAIGATTAQTTGFPPGFGFSLTATGTSDVYNLDAVLTYSSNTAMLLPIFICVDGVLTSPQQQLSYQISVGGSSSAPLIIVYFATITGLSAGTHTLTIAVGPIANPESITVGYTGSYTRCQRVF
jgi:hypothetical protein